MRNKDNKHIGIEVDKELHFKLHYISKYEGRSANGQILYLIRKNIKEFEIEHGKIDGNLNLDKLYTAKYFGSVLLAKGK